MDANERAQKPQTRPKLELVGHDGNAMSVLGRARLAARKAGWTPIQVKAYMDEATKGDYDNLLAVTMDWFDVDAPESSEDEDNG